MRKGKKTTKPKAGPAQKPGAEFSYIRIARIHRISLALDVSPEAAEVIDGLVEKINELEKRLR